MYDFKKDGAKFTGIVLWTAFSLFGADPWAEVTPSGADPLATSQVEVNCRLLPHVDAGTLRAEMDGTDLTAFLAIADHVWRVEAGVVTERVEEAGHQTRRRLARFAPRLTRSAERGTLSRGMPCSATGT